MATYTEIRNQMLESLAAGDYKYKTFTVDGNTIERPGLSEFQALLKYVTDKALEEEQAANTQASSRTRAVSMYGRCR